MQDARDKLVLVGGGHAHLGVLTDWVRHGTPSQQCTLLTPASHTRYSGMIPGTVAGRYPHEAGLIELEALARRAGARIVLGRCESIDPDRGSIITDAGDKIEFDYCSIDVGGVGSAGALLGQDPRIMDVRPVATFLERLDEHAARSAGSPRHVVVVGGGAGGVELAFALRARLGIGVTVTLAAGKKGLLEGFSAMTCTLVRSELGRQDIRLTEEDAQITETGLRAGGEALEPVDLIVAALPAAAPEWPGQGGLASDPDGFIAVDRHQRSLSHPNILAAGDVAARQDRHVPRSGVHAVHTGPVLAGNLRYLVAGEGKLRSYRPRPASLYLLSTGNGGAIASYGPLAAQGVWAGRLKHRIDTRWIESFASLIRDV